MMKEGTEFVRKFPVKAIRKNHFCRICRKKIFKGEPAVISQYKQVRYYPVKGLMGFVNYTYSHLSCDGNGG